MWGNCISERLRNLAKIPNSERDGAAFKPMSRDSKYKVLRFYYFDSRENFGRHVEWKFEGGKKQKQNLRTGWVDYDCSQKAIRKDKGSHEGLSWPWVK